MMHLGLGLGLGLNYESTEGEKKKEEVDYTNIECIIFYQCQRGGYGNHDFVRISRSVNKVPLRMEHLKLYESTAHDRTRAHLPETATLIHATRIMISIAIPPTP